MTLARVRRPTCEARSAARKASPITYTPPWKYRTIWRGSIPSTVISAGWRPPHPPRGEHPVDDKDVVHTARHAVCAARPLVLERQAVLIDAAKPGVEVSDDLLASDHENDVLGSRYQRAQLAAAGRGDEQRSVLRHGMHAADHILGGRGEHTHLVLLHLPIHLVQTQTKRLVASRALDVLGDADGLERPRRVVEDLSPFHEQGPKQAPGLPARGH